MCRSGDHKVWQLTSTDAVLRVLEYKQYLPACVASSSRCCWQMVSTLLVRPGLRYCCAIPNLASTAPGWKRFNAETLAGVLFFVLSTRLAQSMSNTSRAVNQTRHSMSSKNIITTRTSLHNFFNDSAPFSIINAAVNQTGISYKAVGFSPEGSR